MKIFSLDTSDTFVRQRIYDKLYDRTATAVIECLKKHDDPNLGDSGLTIRIVNHDAIDFNLDFTTDPPDYAVRATVERVVYNDENSFRLYCSGMPNGSHSITVRSNAGMTIPFVYIRDFFRLLRLVKHIVEGTPLSTQETL